jgi:anti-sigma regulatory factor (Ser/Thr protein kinase)
MHADASISLELSPEPGRRRSVTGVRSRAGADGALPGGVAVTLAAGADAPRLARRAVARALEQWEQDRRDAALLVISELVTNAVRHGSCSSEDRVLLDVRRRGRTTRIEVTDPHARGGTIGEVTLGGEGQRSGWGLPIVAELTDRWGVERGQARTCVWCELDDVV